MADQVVSLADRLRERRAELGISQSQAARELDVARTAYRLWEMDSARPAPDRWRLIARWLGISVSTLLMAEELMSQDEAGFAGVALAELEETSRSRRARADAPPVGEFFVDARELLASALEAGELTREATRHVHEVLNRIEESQRAAPGTSPWEATEMLRDLPADERAPQVATSGLRFVAAGIPESTLDEAERLMGDLVAMSVRRAGGIAAGRNGVSISVGRDTLRVEVIDAARSLGEDGLDDAAQLAQLAQQASRWGGGSDRGRRTAWFEIDLPTPGLAAIP
jgi:transcriptional regulator with XRE-family HTH domain